MRHKMFSGISLVAVLALTACGADAASKDSVINTETEEQVGATIDTNETTEAQVTSLEDLSFSADLNRNGIEETIMIQGVKQGGEGMLSVVENDEVLYSESIPANYALGCQFYLVSREGTDSIMRYFPLIDHDMASCQYEVFYLDENAEKIVEAADGISVSLFETGTMDTTQWEAFAEQENDFFGDAFLLVSTSEGELKGGSAETPIRYTETYAWMVREHDAGTLTDNLDSFIEEMKDYGEWAENETVQQEIEAFTEGLDWTASDLYDQESENGTHIYLSTVSETEGYLLYCSSPACGIMEKYVYRTQDGGESFEPVCNLSHGMENYPLGFAFCTETKGLIITQNHGSETYAYMTEDGGATWKPYELDVPDASLYYYIDGVSLKKAVDDENTWELILAGVLDDRQEFRYISSDDWETWELQ